MKFITYNDSPGGVYNSQVIDVCQFLQTTFNIPVELFAFVSARNYFNERKKIKSLYKNATVLPSYPGIENWRKNKYLLHLFMLFRKRDSAIGRGVFATLIALHSGKFSKVCFDSRSAYAAEWKEYLSKESATIAEEMPELEKEALLNSNFRIAVSEKLVDYWKENYGYDKSRHVVIPCTINSSSKQSIHTDSTSELRNQMGVSETDTLFVFSGSKAGWQSMSSLYKLLKTAFIENDSLKLLVLSKDAIDTEFLNKFPDRVIHKWVEPKIVSSYLAASDYGLLYREESDTNKVSSPVKFGEYMAAGLPVVISNNVGDYSSFVKEKNCGFLFGSIHWNTLKRPSPDEKTRIQQIAAAHLTKQAYAEMYAKIVNM